MIVDSPDQKAMLVEVRAAKRSGESVADVLFKHMSHEAQGAALRAHPS